MSVVEIVLAFVKIALLLLFFLNMAAIATWADRRQSAMVQDRVGPNRAVLHLPNWAGRALVFLPALLMGGVAMIMFFREPSARVALERMTVALQLSVLVGWCSVGLLCADVRARGPRNRAEKLLGGISPRSVFYGGLAVHLFVFATTRLVPRDALVAGARVSGGLLWVVIVTTGYYAAARMHSGRIPLRLAGMLHAAADAVKLFMKEDFVPKNADRLLHGLAPMIALFPALVAFAVLPFGDTLCFGEGGDKGFDFSDLGRLAPTLARDGICRGHEVKLQIADLNVGILYVFALGSTGVIGAALAGWASDNKYALLGGLRAASQMVSYEVAMGLSLVGLFIVTGTVRLDAIVRWQAENAWGVFVQPLGFLLFLVALAAEGKRVPFDQPEGESEIVAGYLLEYSGMKFGMFFTGEYIELIASSALLVVLFFGGHALPFVHPDGLTISLGSTVLYQFKMAHVAVTVLGVLAFFTKTIFVAFIQIFFRWTLPRFRYDQLMKLGWKKLLPLALANLAVTGTVVLALHGASPTVGNATRLAADITQLLVAFAAAAGAVAFVAGLLEPSRRNKLIRSTAARFAAAAGGTRASPQQA